jgi:hypothetical protein
MFQFADRAISRAGVGVERALDDLHDGFRDLGSEIAQSRLLAALVCRANVAQLRAFDGEAPRQQIEEQHPNAVDVARDSRGAAGQQLRRHVQRCSG